MMKYSNLRRTTSPWRANAVTLVALVAITFWSAQQRPNVAPQVSHRGTSLNTSAGAQVQPKSMAVTPDTAGQNATSQSSTSLEANGLLQVAYNPAPHGAVALTR